MNARDPLPRSLGATVLSHLAPHCTSLSQASAYCPHVTSPAISPYNNDVFIFICAQACAVVYKINSTTGERAFMEKIALTLYWSLRLHLLVRAHIAKVSRKNPLKKGSSAKSNWMKIIEQSWRECLLVQFKSTLWLTKISLLWLEKRSWATYGSKNWSFESYKILVFQNVHWIEHVDYDRLYISLDGKGVRTPVRREPGSSVVEYFSVSCEVVFDTANIFLKDIFFLVFLISCEWNWPGSSFSLWTRTQET